MPFDFSSMEIAKDIAKRLSSPGKRSPFFGIEPLKSIWLGSVIGVVSSHTKKDRVPDSFPPESEMVRVLACSITT